MDGLDTPDSAALAAAVAAALLFAGVNGFHDSAHAIATSVSTRALTPRVAIGMAALMNFVGAFLGTEVARTVSEGLVAAPDGRAGLLLVLAALAGAVGWGGVAWLYGLPLSSTHALFGGLVGATLAAGAGQVHWDGVLLRVVLPMAAAPLLALTLGYLVMVALLWAFRRAHPHRAQRGFRVAQTVSTAAMALGHGLQDAQKAMGVVVLALLAAGQTTEGAPVPLWVTVACAVMLAAGTAVGGWRVLRTLGRRVFAVDPPRGFAAEATAASVLFSTAYLFAAPVSSTHTITSSLMGVGATRRLTAVRWGVAKSMVSGWFLTLPAVAVVSAGLYGLGSLLLH